MNTFGFIGVGNMGGALAAAVCKNCPPSSVVLSNRTRRKAELLAEKLGCRAADNAGAAGSAKYLFLGVKPQTMPELFAEISRVLAGRYAAGDRFILVTMAAGLTMDAVAAMSGVPAPVIRIMPNTPLSVGEGMILYTAGGGVTEGEISDFVAALKGCGRLDRLEESQIDAAGVISGCGPAFVFQFAEALAKAGEGLGLSGEQARLYAEQTILGAAKLALETGEDLEKLRKAVCSPGGTTIEGVKSFEREDLNGMTERALRASYRRTLELAGKKG